MKVMLLGEVYVFDIWVGYLVALLTVWGLTYASGKEIEVYFKSKKISWKQKILIRLRKTFRII